MEALEFDVDSHVYRLNGRVIPSTTQVLSAMGASPGFAFLSDDELEFYRSRGKAVHRMVELSVSGTLDHRTISHEVKPYLPGWEAFQHDYNPEVLTLNGELFAERHLCHPLFGYGTTPDLALKIGKETGVLEIKATSAHTPATGLQTAAQLIAVRYVMPKIGDMRIGLRLLPKPPYYDLRYYTDKTDEAVWLSLLNGFAWLKTHKLLKENPR